MSKLDLIWALENHNNKLYFLTNELEDLGKNIEINILKKKIGKIEGDKIEIFGELNKAENFIRKSENKLKNIKFKTKELERSLYDGINQDIKELEYLDMEKDRYMEEIDRLETEIIQTMELEEEIQIAYKELESLLYEYNNNLNLYEREVDGRKFQLSQEIKEVQLLIKKIIPDIPGEYLGIYDKIRKHKQRAIVGVENYICLGCGVRIPTYFGTSLKAREDLVYCENCGRILYFLK